MDQGELQIVEQLTGAAADHIRLANDGFWSRGYVVDGGRIVFKFRKSPEVSYNTEIKMLNFINSLGLNINTQKVGWISPNDDYLGIYGVLGQSLDTVESPDYNGIGRQLAAFLHELHRAKPADAETMSQEEEIAAWQDRYQKSYNELSVHFTVEEIERLDELFVMMIGRLRKLEEKLVFSHGDLGDGNIFIDEAGKVGVIDFSEMLYLDEAADFMDVGSEGLRKEMLMAYGADDILKEKVEIRVSIRPLFVFGDYARRGDTEYVEELIQKIRKLLEKNHGGI